jgi:hypothetical protein
MLCRLFLWWCQRRWDMNLTSVLARVEFESAVDMSNTTAKMIWGINERRTISPTQQE